MGCGQVFQAVKLIERGAKRFENVKPIPSPNEAKPQTFISAPGIPLASPCPSRAGSRDMGAPLGEEHSPEQRLFFQQKNIDFILISASADIQELREMSGTGPALPQAVAPHPRPTAGLGAPHGLPRAPAGASICLGPLPPSRPLAQAPRPGPSLLPWPRSGEPLLGRHLSKMPRSSRRGIPRGGDKHSGFLEHRSNSAGPLLAQCGGAWREQRGDGAALGSPGSSIPLPHTPAPPCPGLQHPLSCSIPARQGMGSVPRVPAGQELGSRALTGAAGPGSGAGGMRKPRSGYP